MWYYAADYYPFGTVLQSGGIPSRYGYQGEYAEKDGDPAARLMRSIEEKSSLINWLE